MEIWLAAIITFVMFVIGVEVGKKCTKPRNVDGLIFWNEKGINLHLGISISELAMERDYVVLQVLPNNDVRDDILPNREMDDDSNRVQKGGN